MDFIDTEQKDGSRFVWNVFPTLKTESQKYVIPQGILYSPFSIREQPSIYTEGKPLTCTGCQWIGNRFCGIDYSNLRWDCCNCGVRNNLPPAYREFVAEGNSIIEFSPDNFTVDYKISNCPPPVWCIMIDCSVPEIEFENIKKQLIDHLTTIEGINIMIVTFGKNIQLHDLVSPYCTESLLSGEADYTADSIRNLLKLKCSEKTIANFNRFIQPIESCRDRILSLVERLESEGDFISKDKRRLRATGQALFITQSVLETFGGTGRISILLGGPCTRGKGKVVSEMLEESIRQHKDLEKDSSKTTQFEKGRSFYNELLDRVIKSNFTVDVFAFCLDQYGAGEMRELIEKSGGIIVNQEEFTHPVFDESLSKYVSWCFNPDSVFGGQIKVITDNRIVINGSLGPLRLVKKEPEISKHLESPIGENGGNEFYIGATTYSSTYLFFLSYKEQSLGSVSNGLCFQIRTTYYTKRGEKMLRVSTFRKEHSSSISDINEGFDQETAIATIARICCAKAEQIQVVDLVYWLNSILIKTIRKLSDFEPSKPSSLKIPNSASLLPQFIYYFRKSNFVQKFGTSIDESAFNKMALNRETLSNMLVMIQPALFRYDSENEEPIPVLCDFESLKTDSVILVDTYFYVLIWRGASVHSWIESKYHEYEEYPNIKRLYEKPGQDANIIKEDRLPEPSLITCYQGSPNERILKSKLNPPSSQSSNSDYQIDENYITDDVNLKTFNDFLSKLVVKND